MDFTYLSRLQFALTTMFHILWPVHVIGMSIFLFVVEALWLKTRDTDYYRHARFWPRLLLLNIAIGVATGIPLEFEFGTNWSPFAESGADFFGNMLGFEAAMAFMLEASFLGIMLFGWGRGRNVQSTIAHNQSEEEALWNSEYSMSRNRGFSSFWVGCRNRRRFSSDQR